MPRDRPTAADDARLQPFERDGLGGDYEAVHVVQDEGSGLRAFIAIHSSRLGPTAGGIRRAGYASVEHAFTDALRLAASMTYKFALADVPAGGGKTVIIDHDGLDRGPGYRVIGRTIERLGGAYLCGPDVGTTEADLDEVRTATAHVNRADNDPARSTALGVVAGIEGTLDVLKGTASFDGASFVVQGLGSVGLAVAQRLVAAGGHVVGADPAEAAQRQAKAIGVELVEPNDALGTACDVLVPCAMGGVLDERTIDRLGARAVCGSANDQLASMDIARKLHERGVLVAPDIVVNAGAAIEGVLTDRHGGTPAVRKVVAERIGAIRERTRDVLTTASDEDRAPMAVALERARARLAEGPRTTG